MKHLKTYDQLNEGVKTLILATLLSLGITKADAQKIQDDQKKLAVVDTIAKYNNMVDKGYAKDFSTYIREYHLDAFDPEKLKKYIKVEGNKVQVKKSFVDGSTDIFYDNIGANIGFDNKMKPNQVGIEYRIKF